jgi:WS/DGAT/MGAT family acyltransferase
MDGGVDTGTSRPTTTVDRPALAGQVLLGLALFGVYLLIDAIGGAGRRTEALRHGRWLFDLEQRLHIDVERSLNGWLAPHHTLSTLANYEYATTYILSAIILLAWVWLRRPEQWRFARDSFVVLNLIAFATFLLYPTAPPRMLSGLGFVDTVSRGHTVGSWGSGLVDTANQLAAMPSLHIGWALWVSVVLARFTVGWRWQVLSAMHVLLTLFVVMATANHYLLDAVAVVVPILVGVWYAQWRHDGPPGEVVASCDAFFLHVEATGAPQHVGGVVLLDRPPGNPRPTVEQLRAVVRDDLLPRTRFHQRLAPRAAGSRTLRRHRWVDTDVDLSVQVLEQHAPGGLDDLWRLIGEAAAEPLPRDRPLWRWVIVPDVDLDRSAAYVLVHHAMADGLGTVARALDVFRPRTVLPAPPQPPPAGPVRRAVRRAAKGIGTGAVVVAGLGQLATDGGAARLPEGSTRRSFAGACVALDDLRAAARRHAVRVTDVVLMVAAEGVRRAAPGLVDTAGGSIRVAVTQTLAAPGTTRSGNATTSVMIDVPLDDRPLADRLADVARATARRRRPTRLVASRFVMATALRAVPEPAAAWFARTVYGGRFFHAVVSNMPGPADRLTLLGLHAPTALPILPVAPGAAMSLGALTWSGRVGLGVATDAALVDAAAVAVAVPDALAELLGSAGRRPGEDEEQAGALPR